VNQLCQLYEISEAQARPPGGHHHEGIVRNHAGPARRQATNLIRLIDKENPILTPAPLVAEQGVFTTEQGVERVGNSETSILILRIGCIRQPCQTGWRSEL
jgi:hypothetical protein